MDHYKKLTLLHSNDLHGDFMAEKVDEHLVGGVSLLSGYIEHVRDTEENVLYAVAGDMFRGSIIDMEYRGISTIEIMNLLAPDVVTLGNHEVDYGVAHLLFIEKCARFPIINANLYIKTNGVRLFTPYKLVRIGGMNVLFIGVITEEVLAQARQDGLIGSFIDTAEAAREVQKLCNAHAAVDVDVTVLLTHIGFEEDKKLAERLDPSCGVDIIIGGHSHTFMEQPEIVNGIVIAQAGTGTDRIGRFDITVDTEKNCIHSFNWQSVPIDTEHCPSNPELEALIRKYKEVTDQKYARVLTRFPRMLTHPARNQETELGDLFADILRDSLGIDIMLLASGSIRKGLGPIVDLAALKETFPFEDGLFMVRISGAQLRQMLRFMLRDEYLSGETEFYQISEGLRFVYSRSDHDFQSFTWQGAEIRDDQTFTVGLQGYHFNNMEDFFGLPLAEASRLQKPRAIATSALDILEEYFEEHPRVEPKARQRMTIID